MASAQPDIMLQPLDGVKEAWVYGGAFLFAERTHGTVIAPLGEAGAELLSDRMGKVLRGYQQVTSGSDAMRFPATDLPVQPSLRPVDEILVWSGDLNDDRQLAMAVELQPEGEARVSVSGDIEKTGRPFEWVVDAGTFFDTAIRMRGLSFSAKPEEGGDMLDVDGWVDPGRLLANFFGASGRFNCYGGDSAAFISRASLPLARLAAAAQSEPERRGERLPLLVASHNVAKLALLDERPRSATALDARALEDLPHAVEYRELAEGLCDVRQHFTLGQLNERWGRIRTE